MCLPYVVVSNPNELAIISGVGYSKPSIIDGFVLAVACVHKVQDF